MRILLHDNQLCERGTTNSVLNYARALRGGGHDVSIAYRASHPENVPTVVVRVSKEFDLVGYDYPSELSMASKRFDVSYFQKSGNRDGLQSLSDRVLVHAVFQEFDPHGSHYFYISDWLARRVRERIFRPNSPKESLWAARALWRGARSFASGMRHPFEFDYLPYICDMPMPSGEWRTRLGVPSEAFVVLRYGGFNTFDIPWASQVLDDFLDSHSDAFFIGVNTPAVISHTRAIFLPPVFNDTDKSDLLSSANLFLTARSSGESFGLANVEALQAGLPVLGYAGGWDRNQVEMLGPLNGLYLTPDDLVRQLSTAYVMRDSHDAKVAKAAGDRYRPHVVLKDFERILSL